MPEGDTIHRTAAALRTAVLGKPLTAFEAPRLTGLRPALGAVIERVESKGKHLEIGFDDGVVLHTHMRMTGSWHLYRAGEQWRKSTRHARVIIEVPGWQAVCFSAPVVRTYRAREFVPNPRLAELGPDLCRPDADIAECVDRIDRCRAPDTTVAEVLLDQRIACGVGNVYKSEVLWATELHPVHPDRRPGARAARGAARHRGQAAPGQPRPPAAGHRARCARRGRRLRPPPEAVLPLRHARRGGQARRARPRHLLVPGLPAAPGASSRTTRWAQSAGSRRISTRRRPVEDGWYDEDDERDEAWAPDERRPTTRAGDGAEEPAEPRRVGSAEDAPPTTWIDGEAAGLFDDVDDLHRRPVTSATDTPSRRATRRASSTP